MQPMQQLPIFSDVADWFAHPVLTSGSQPGVTINAAGGSANGFVTLTNDNYFALCGWACVTNYDNAAPEAATADSTTILPAPTTVPNAFTVAITRSGKTVYSNQPLTQAELCSSGYSAGKQMPFPVIYAPSITFDFVFTDLTQLFLLDGDDVAIPLSISLWMVGYNIRKSNWQRFLNIYPGLAAAGY